MENVYPKWLYHAECDPILVKDTAQHRAVGSLWAESPDEARQVMEATKTEADEPKRLGKKAKAS